MTPSDREYTSLSCAFVGTGIRLAEVACHGTVSIPQCKVIHWIPRGSNKIWGDSGEHWGGSKSSLTSTDAELDCFEVLVLAQGTSTSRDFSGPRLRPLYFPLNMPVLLEAEGGREDGTTGEDDETGECVAAQKGLPARSSYLSEIRLTEEPHGGSWGRGDKYILKPDSF